MNDIYHVHGFPNFRFFFSIFSEREEDNILLHVGTYEEEKTRIRKSWSKRQFASQHMNLATLGLIISRRRIRVSLEFLERFP